jgi:putative endonuclease
LIYFEEFENGEDATIREEQFKKWKRELIEEMNSSWSDLSLNENLDFKKLRKKFN